MPHSATDAPRLDHAGVCFHPDDDRRDHSGVCFHPDDDRRGNGGRCHHAADTPTTTSCFRPADDEPVAIGAGRPVNSCHHPSEPGDLAADLHRTLTDFEQEHLAALSSRS
ncbi:hypothetical protein [Actinoplanes sp. NPDC026619]|uniref:hypothetical protein n=1 Tax=Actinoplanes sp. NPDC026619 TaxID=3155798 RepID=UPI0033D298BD